MCAYATVCLWKSKDNSYFILAGSLLLFLPCCLLQVSWAMSIFLPTHSSSAWTTNVYHCISLFFFIQCSWEQTQVTRLARQVLFTSWGISPNLLPIIFIQDDIPKVSGIEYLVPILALLGSGRIFKSWGLVGGPQSLGVCHQREWWIPVPTLVFLFWFPAIQSSIVPSWILNVMFCFNIKSNY